MTDLDRQLLRAEFRTNYFLGRDDRSMFIFWSRIYYHLRRRVNKEVQ